VNSIRNTYTYDENNNRIERLRQDWENSDWVISWRDAYTYDENNNQIEWLRQDWENSELVNSWRTIDYIFCEQGTECYPYDSFGNCIATGDKLDVNGLDCSGECGGSNIPVDDCCEGSVLDECGVCDGDGIADGACNCEGNTSSCNLCPTININGYGDCDVALGYALTGQGCESITGCGYGEDENLFYSSLGECNLDNENCQNCKVLDLEGYGDCEMAMGVVWTGNTCEVISGCGMGNDAPWFYDNHQVCMTRCSYGYTGCIDETACNYDSTATVDDGSCEYPEDFGWCECGGDAILDDCGVCGGNGYVDWECNDGSSTCWNIADGECDCDGNVLDECNVCGGDNSTCTGCTDPNASNYDLYATIDDGNCVLAIEMHTIPQYYNISSIYPNPFNPVTSITYGLPENTDIQITVYDMGGTQVTSLVNTLSEWIVEIIHKPRRWCWLNNPLLQLFLSNPVRI